jgi:porin
MSRFGYRLVFWVARLMALVSAGAGAEPETKNGSGTSAPATQTSYPTRPAPTQALDPPPVERVFGDSYGMQPKLEALGINLQVDALTEFAGNVSGGTRHGATFANQIGFQNDINWERLAGVTGLSTHVIIVNRSGSSASRVFGDNLLAVQEIYGSGGNVVAHLVLPV